ncbi:MAG: hypothetical protein Q7R41_04625 [Phycisphaerales bacterium]|nr:hypothetical protein [Phycisphaerales bacterium]
MIGTAYTSLVDTNSPSTADADRLQRIRCPRCQGEGYLFDILRFSLFLGLGVAFIVKGICNYYELLTAPVMPRFGEKDGTIWICGGVYSIYYAATSGRRRECDDCRGVGKVAKQP